MGNHRAERTERTGPSETSQAPYVGRRVAQPPVTVAVAADVAADVPVAAAVATEVGKRRAVKHAGSRGPLFRGLPSSPVLLGVAVLAVAVSGVMMSTPEETTTQLTSSSDTSGDSVVRAASAVSGVSGVGTVNTLRGRDLTRSSSREALQQAAGDELVEAAEAQVEVRNEALGQLQAKAEQQAKKLADNRWVMPLSPVILTATYGQYGLWANYHTGLDFNGNTGDPISAVAGGVVTSVGYDGSYGNKTVITLSDGTEIWYAHQTSQYVSVGQSVAAGAVIGTVGATGKDLLVQNGLTF